MRGGMEIPPTTIGAPVSGAAFPRRRAVRSIWTRSASRPAPKNPRGARREAMAKGTLSGAARTPAKRISATRATAQGTGGEGRKNPPRSPAPIAMNETMAPMNAVGAGPARAILTIFPWKKGCGCTARSTDGGSKTNDPTKSAARGPRAHRAMRGAMRGAIRVTMPRGQRDPKPRVRGGLRLRIPRPSPKMGSLVDSSALSCGRTKKPKGAPRRPHGCGAINRASFSCARRLARFLPRKDDCNP